MFKLHKNDAMPSNFFNEIYIMFNSSQTGLAAGKTNFNASNELHGMRFGCNHSSHSRLIRLPRLDHRILTFPWFHLVTIVFTVNEYWYKQKLYVSQIHPNKDTTHSCAVMTKCLQVWQSHMVECEAMINKGNKYEPYTSLSFHWWTQEPTVFVSVQWRTLVPGWWFIQMIQSNSFTL